MRSKLNAAIKGVSIPVAFACAISAVMAVASTAAYLTSTSSDVNVFAMGRVQVELTEADTDGKQEKPDGTTVNFYELSPGAVISKDPQVTVPAGGEACWVFVKLEESANLGSYVSYSVDGGWTQLADADGNPVAGVFYREVDEGDAGQALPVLANNQVRVSDTVTWSQLAELEAAIEADPGTSPTLTISAFAVQRAGIDSPLKAWERISG